MSHQLHQLHPNVSKTTLLTFSIALFFGTFIGLCHSHGRLIEPPSRSSAWRYGFQTPPNYNDHELYCGGFTRQQRNGGKCGECGDPWDLPPPRANEYGGRYGQGVVVRKYNPGSDITLRVELTASHMGYFEFRVCPELAAKQECLDKHVLELLGGSPSVPHPNDLSTRFYPRSGSRIYQIKGRLPNGLACPNCVLQWRYIAGNNWGMCPDGNGAVGCGAQEEFRACADINIGDVGPQPPLRPLRPGTKPTSRFFSTDEKIVDKQVNSQNLIDIFRSTSQMKFRIEQERDNLYCAALDCFAKLLKTNIESFGPSERMDVCRALIGAKLLTSRNEDVCAAVLNFLVEVFRPQPKEQLELALLNLMANQFSTQLDMLSSRKNGNSSAVNDLLKQFRQF